MDHSGCQLDFSGCLAVLANREDPSQPPSESLIKKYNEVFEEQNKRFVEFINNIEKKANPYIPLEMVPSLARGPVEGRRLVEVMSVHVHFKGKEPLSIYGTVGIGDGRRGELVVDNYLFNRERDDSEVMFPDRDNSLLLNGPDGAIIGDKPYHFILDLKDKDSDETREGLFYGVYSGVTAEDEPKCVDLLQFWTSGNLNIGMTAKYVQLSRAVPAIVEVTLIRSRSAVGNVSGFLTARNGYLEDEYKSYLFKNDGSHGDIQVSPGKVIPLTRSVVAIHLRSCLLVGAGLYHGDEEIACGTAEFPVHSYGIMHQEIRGKYGAISVKVTWKLY